jgi:hypothetical protein
MIEHSCNRYRCPCGCYHGTHRHHRVTLSALCPKCRDDLNRKTVEGDNDMDPVRDAEATGVLLQFASGL